MPSLKKLRRLAAEKAKLSGNSCVTLLPGGGLVPAEPSQVAIESAVAKESVASNDPIFEIEPKKAVLASETGVSSISPETPIPAISSQNEAIPGNDMANAANGLESQGMAAVEPVLVRIYGKPINPRIRFIEFEDGSHGRLWVNQKAAPMIGWTVWVKPYEDIPEDWVMHGRYNSMGVRRS